MHKPQDSCGERKAEKRKGLTLAEMSLFPNIIDLLSESQHMREELTRIKHRLTVLESSSMQNS